MHRPDGDPSGRQRFRHRDGGRLRQPVSEPPGRTSRIASARSAVRGNRGGVASGEGECVVAGASRFGIGARIEPPDRAAPSKTFAGIYGIVDSALVPAPLEALHALLDGGIRLVQYRAKSGVDAVVVRALTAAARARGARLVVNDDFEAALLADGWHAGQEDLAGLDPVLLRARLGTRIFGVSCGLAEEARRAEAFGADYVGVGPFAATGTKLDAGPAIGIDGVRAVVEAVRLPVVAIGGIDAANLRDVAASGAAMAAVVSAIARAPEPAAAAGELVRLWAALVP